MKTWLVLYELNGDEYSFDIVADTIEEAESHLAAIKHSASIEGEVYYSTYQEPLPTKH